MSRQEEWTEFLFPHVPMFMKDWFGTFAHAQIMLGLTHIPRSEWYSLTSGGNGRPEHCKEICRKLRDYGRIHNLEGWKEITV